MRHPRLEMPADQMPALHRPGDWSPRIDEQVIFFPGQGYPIVTGRIVLLNVEPGRHLVGVGRQLGTVPEARLWPLKEWREIRAREDFERGVSDEIEF